jgi:hypothetical protein
MKRPERLATAALLILLGACSSEPKPAPSSQYLLPAPPPTGEPAGYLGMTTAQLQASFGKPAFTRRENGSELWRYDNGQCRTFFFLYPSGREMAVRHVETIPQGKGVAADPACLTALRARPASRTS